MYSHDILIFVFILAIYVLFYYPTNKIIETYDKFNYKTLDERLGQNYKNINETGLEKLPHLPTTTYGLADNDCLSKGRYLGKEDIFEDCELLCNTKGTTHIYLPKDDLIFYGNKKLKQGSWCLPEDYASCNLSLSRIIWNGDNDSWNCTSKSSSLFGGPGNNVIIGCNGSIVNTKTNQLYTKTIPPTLNITDIDEQWFDPQTKQTRYVYECAAAYDPHQVEYIGDDLGDRFVRQKNYCGIFVFDSDQAITDFKNHDCICNGNMNNFLYGPATPCNACGLGYTYKGPLGDYGFIEPQFCVQKNMDLQDVRELQKFRKTPLLCGLSKYNKGRAACLTGFVIKMDTIRRV